MDTTNETPVSPAELLALIKEAVDSLSDGFAVLDAEHRLIFANDVSHRSFGSAFGLYAQGLGLRDAMLAGVRRERTDLDDATANAVADGLTNRLLSGKPTDLASDDGKIVQTTYRRMSGGRMATVSVDITMLRQREKELSVAKTKAEAANRAKSDFLANISHEIRTPLNGMLGMAQVLVAGDLKPDQREQAEAILESGKSLMSIVNDVLDLAKVEAGRLELSPVDHDLSHLLRRLQKLWSVRAEEKGIKLIVTPDARLPARLRFDPVRVGQCISNLISNAIKFTERGLVTVVASADDITCGTPTISVRVEDSGVGMSEETLAKLFQPFSQADASTSRQFGGTGLGLFITRKLAQLMGGDTTVESTLHRGSVFTLSFKAEIADVHASPSKLIEAGNGGGSAKAFNAQGIAVLLVDDQPLNRKVAGLFLAPHGFKVTEATNGREALDLLEAQPFDLVLLDVHMPVMDGLETVRRIRAGDAPWACVPVIALTADAMSGEREKLLALGMSGYVSKPIDQRELFSEICRVLGEDRQPSAAPKAAASA
jgi:signal transduction histidine kinase/CheY-like chemotaxis protein